MYLLPGNDFSKKCCNFFADFALCFQKREVDILRCGWNIYLSSTSLNHNCSVCVCWSPWMWRRHVFMPNLDTNGEIYLREEDLITSGNGYWHNVRKGAMGKWLGFFISTDKAGWDSWTRLLFSDRRGRLDSCMFHRHWIVREMQMQQNCCCSGAVPPI